MSRGKRNPLLRAEIEAALKAGATVPSVVATFSGRASRTNVYRIAKQLAAAPALPEKPPGSEHELDALVRALAWPSASDEDRARLRAIVRDIAVTTLAMARADAREEAGTAETLRALRRVAGLATELQAAITEVPNLVRPGLLKLLSDAHAWEGGTVRRTVERVIAMVQEEAQAEGAAGRGTLRKRMLGDAFDYLGGEAIALWKTHRPADGDILDVRGPFGEFVAQLWSYATGRGADGIPFLEERARRWREAEAVKDSARRLRDEARELTKAGLPAQDLEAAADVAHARAQRVARGRGRKASQHRAGKT